MKLRMRKMTGPAMALAILVSPVLAQQSPINPVKSAAIVNGEPISLTDVDAIMKKQPPPPHPLSEAQKREVRREITEMLIDDLLMQQFLRTYGAKIEPAAVDKEIGNLVASLKAQNRTLADFCKDTGQNETQLRTNVGFMLQWADFVKNRVSDADLQKYFQSNKDFFDRTTVKASHVLLRVPMTANSEAERQAATAKMTAISQEIAANKLTFEDAVKKYSECPSAAQKGDIGYFPRKWSVAEPFAQAAFTLKVGETSNVVQTEYGVHLIKVTDRKNGVPAVYEKVKEDVRESYMMEMRQALLEQQRKAAKIEITLP